MSLYETIWKLLGLLIACFYEHVNILEKCYWYVLDER